MKQCLVLFIILAFSVLFLVENVGAVEGDAVKGKALYLKHCADCHGSEGKGDGWLRFDPAIGDLTSPRIQQQSDFKLWQSVHRGGSHSAMKSWKWTLSETEIAMVLAYVRSLTQ